MATDDNTPGSKPYDVILFGVTGFTGQLAAEYILRNYRPAPYPTGLHWAACARNAEKAKEILEEILSDLQEENEIYENLEIPPILAPIDLVCTTDQQEAALKEIVRQCKVVLTTSGPFEKYGTALVKVCAELGVHYADITGETDFVRRTIQLHHATCQTTGAVVVHHCGNDCVPQDLTVFEMHKYAKEHALGQLTQAKTFCEFSKDSTWSGGTLATAQYQLSKNRASATKPAFDPLLQAADGTKSTCSVKNISPKAVTVDADFAADKNVGPWIMAPVMTNCIRRSNALLQYSPELQYGDAILKESAVPSSWGEMMSNVKKTADEALFMASIKAPALFARFLPKPGEGPDRDAMEEGYLILHGRGVIQQKEKIGEEETVVQEVKVQSTFRFNKDIAYLYTAALLVEAGMLLLETKQTGGVYTPASAFGSEYTTRILQQLDATFTIEQVQEVEDSKGGEEGEVTEETAK